MEARKKVTLSYILEKKANGEKLARTALYDYPMAILAEEAGIEIINMGQVPDFPGSQRQGSP